MSKKIMLTPSDFSDRNPIPFDRLCYITVGGKVSNARGILAVSRAKPAKKIDGTWYFHTVNGKAYKGGQFCPREDKFFVTKS